MPPSPTNTSPQQLRGFRNRFFGVKSTPSVRIVFLFVVIFLLFAILLVVAAVFPIKPLWFTILIDGILSPIVFILITCYSVFRRRGEATGGRPKYVPNLGNTVTLLLFSFPTFTTLYTVLWYPNLRSNTLVASADSVNSTRFPSIAIFQRNDWTSQGNLRGKSSKCYLGWYNDDSPPCAELDPEILGNSTTCTCKEMWYNNAEIVEDFVWMNTSYRYTVFDAPPWLMCNTPTYLMLLQTFFDYNVAKALSDSGSVNPSLFLAVYDPSLGMQQAFEKGHTRMILINANAIVAVNVGLQLRQDLDGVGVYDYKLQLSSSPFTDIVCDTTSEATYQYPCHLSLYITIPNFDRTVIKTQKTMSVPDFVAQMGSYFSFVQFISWLVSLLAFSTG